MTRNPWFWTVVTLVMIAASAVASYLSARAWQIPVASFVFGGLAAASLTTLIVLCGRKRLGLALGLAGVPLVLAVLWIAVDITGDW